MAADNFFGTPPYKGAFGVSLTPFSAFTKRRVFFSFHYDDIMRVNNVRNAWKIDHPDTPVMRSFYDSSLWESRKLEGPESLKRLIREGVENTSAICVLIGTDTWSREWVRYEIARALIDKRGLLGVHINGLNHHILRAPHALGYNPFDHLGLFLTTYGAYYIYEYRDGGWFQYRHYTQSVSLPAYLTPPPPGYVRRLSEGVPIYDFVRDDGHRNIGAWIDAAAQRVGR